MELDLAWAAGLIEGEGCFSLVRNSKAKDGMSAKIMVQMNDLDVVNRLAAVFNVGKVYHRPPRSTSKESWVWTVYRATDVKRVIESVYANLSKRRRAKADQVLSWIGRSCGT